MLDLRQLYIFLAIWETRSFSKAAERVHLTQPTISSHVKALEEELGVVLFDRRGRHVVPTRAAERLLPMARQLLRLSRQASDEMKHFAEDTCGVLELGGSNIPGQYILPGFLGRFKSENSGITIRLKIADTAGIIADVESNGLELGMVGAMIDRKRLVFQPCFRDQLALAVPKGHRFFGIEEISPDELIGEPFIVRESGSGTRTSFEQELLDVHGIRISALNVVAEMGSTEAIRQGVKAGVGVAVFSRRAMEESVRHNEIWPCKIAGMDLSRNFYLVWHSMRTLSPVTLAFKRFLLDNQEDSHEGERGSG